MKRIYLLSLLVIASLACSAQRIYTSVTKYDKFDDVVWQKTIKTLITKTDSTFIIETKGLKPEEYLYFDNVYSAKHIGSRDSLVNLAQDVWGFESDYVVCTRKQKEDLDKAIFEKIKEIPDTLDNLEKLRIVTDAVTYNKVLDFPSITVRTISKYKFTYEYDTDLFWIKFSDGSRIIYNR